MGTTWVESPCGLSLHALSAGPSRFATAPRAEASGNSLGPHGIGGRECACAVSPSLLPLVAVAASPSPFPSRGITSSVPPPRRTDGLLGRLCRCAAQRYRRGARRRGPRPRRGRAGTPRGGLQVSVWDPLLRFRLVELESSLMFVGCGLW